MRRRHFDSLCPICPLCFSERQIEAQLVLATVLFEENESIIEGILHCPNPDCRMEYPIIDGIPIFVPHIRTYIGENIFHITARNDLSEPIESLIGDAVGPATVFDTTRQHLSAYAWDHYGDLDPEEPVTDFAPGAAVRCLEKGLDLINKEVKGPVIDLGCSVGRTSFTIAEKYHELVLGVDVNFSMLLVAQRVLRFHNVSYPRRRIGIVYDRREFKVRFKGAERVDFWVCDALNLPFSSGTFALAIGLNVLDCVLSPYDFLKSLKRILNSTGLSILATPYDWSLGATPLEAWIGGHSQRGPDRGASEPLLRSLLTSGAHSHSIDNFHIKDEIANIPWQVRLHDRSIVSNNVHLIIAEAGKY